MFGMPEELQDMLGRLAGMASNGEAIDNAKKPICMASQEVRDEFDAIAKMGRQAKRLIIEAKARSELLWLKVREIPEFEKIDHLEYDPESGMMIGCTAEDIRKCSKE